MNVFFVTDSPALRKTLDRRRLAWCRSADALKTIAGLSVPTLIYVDPACGKPLLDAVLRAAGKNRHLSVGIIDPRAKVKHVMAIIHRGAVDYLAAAEIPKELTAQRFKQTADYIKKYRQQVSVSPARVETRTRSVVREEYLPVLHGWNDVKAGRKYTFSIMFIELDDREEMEKRYGVKNLSNALVQFKAYVEKNALAFGGKVWLWTNFGGIILFPFNAQECNSVLCGFRMVMYKFLHDAEESHFPNFISFRLALHLGNISYQESKKGEVISDSLNTVFHLGQKFAQPGHFYITEDIFAYSPEPLRPFFRESNSYENRTIYRMRTPVL